MQTNIATAIWDIPVKLFVLFEPLFTICKMGIIAQRDCAKIKRNNTQKKEAKRKITFITIVTIIKSFLPQRVHSFLLPRQYSVSSKASHPTFPIEHTDLKVRRHALFTI